MDGISVLNPSTPAFQPLLYSRGNAVGWLHRSEKTASAPYNLSGRLYLAKSGWLLLSVPNAFVRGVFDALTAPGAELPTTGLMNVPNVDGDVLNAHISVMTAAEVEQIGADKINERGHMFHYALGPVDEIPVHNVEGVSKVWAVQIKSPALAALRKSYGLSPYINNNHQFHITVAARRKKVLANNDISKFDSATGRGELKAAADDKTTYDCCCSGPCMCPPTCICKKSGYCERGKKTAADIPQLAAQFIAGAELMGSRGRAKMYGRPEPSDRDYDYVAFTDDPKQQQQFRRTLTTLAQKHGYKLHERPGGFLTASGNNTDLSFYPTTKRDDIHKAWALQEAGMSKDEAWAQVDAEKTAATNIQERVRVVLPYNGKYLLETLNNPKWPENLGKRRFIGGGIEAGETPAQAAAREMFEELGVKIKPNAFKHVGNDPDKPHEHYVELAKHKIKPGNFNATVGSDAVISLSEGLPTGADYIGPDIKKLLTSGLKRAAADPATTILVSGHSGAGKSTLSKALAEKLKIPLHQIDSHPDQKAFFAVNKDGQETVVGSPVYEEFQKLRKRTAEETLAGINGPAIVEGAQLSALSPKQLSAYKNRVFVHTPLKQLLKQRLERQRTRQLAKGNEWTPELENKKQQIGRAVYDVQNSLMRQYARLPGTLKYTTRKDDIDTLISKLTKSADLLPGGAADNKPDSAFPKKELQKGKKHEREHTNNDQVATEIAKDHLQEEPDYYKKHAEEEVKEPEIIFQLRKAKEHSDAKRYKHKNEILRKLMHRAPEDWFVDDPDKYHMGITHAPTKFRFHADPRIIPVGVPVQKVKAAAKNPYAGHLFDFREPLVVPPNSSMWQKTLAHLQRVVDKGNRTAEMQQRTPGLLAAMDPAYKHQMNMSIARGVWPKPDLLTQLIQRHGSGVLASLG